MKVAIAALAVVVTAGAAFALGRATAPEAPASADRPPGGLSGRETVIGIGDQLRFPAISLFCIASFEIDRAKLLCNREKRPRFQVVFERAITSVGRVGNPGDRRVFRER